MIDDVAVERCADRSLESANAELARLKPAKEDSDAAAAKALEDLQRERRAGDAAEKTNHPRHRPRLDAAEYCGGRSRRQKVD